MAAEIAQREGDHSVARIGVLIRARDCRGEERLSKRSLISLAQRHSRSSDAVSAKREPSLVVETQHVGIIDNRRSLRECPNGVVVGRPGNPIKIRQPHDQDQSRSRGFPAVAGSRRRHVRTLSRHRSYLPSVVQRATIAAWRARTTIAGPRTKRSR
jgi:hypothetical protein